MTGARETGSLRRPASSWAAPHYGFIAEELDCPPAPKPRREGILNYATCLRRGFGRQVKSISAGTTAPESGGEARVEVMLEMRPDLVIP